MENPVLKTEALAVGYRHKNQDVVIASDVVINLVPGKLIALIGANGIGKSTLLRTLTGIQKPLSGKVFLENTEIQQYTAQELSQKLSVVLTEKLPPSNLTVFELVALGRQPYTNWIGTLSAGDLIKTNQAIALTQTEPLRDKRHYELSDGQLQKVLIARALAQDTPVIILDEPTTHLDLQHKASLLGLLKKLTLQTGKSILFSTHDMELALQLSDELMVMTPQKVVQATAENCIASGILDDLFSDGNIFYDAQKGKFMFKDI